MDIAPRPVHDSDLPVFHRQLNDPVGKGIATTALRALLTEVTERPLYARVAADNTGSRRVLEHCGLEVSAHATGHAPARGTEIAELVLTLDT